MYYYFIYLSLFSINAPLPQVQPPPLDLREAFRMVEEILGNAPINLMVRGGVQQPALQNGLFIT